MSRMRDIVCPDNQESATGRAATLNRGPLRANGPVRYALVVARPRPPASGLARLGRCRARWERQERPVGKLEIAAVDRDLALAATRPFDDQFGANRETPWQSVCTIRHNNTLLSGSPRPCLSNVYVD